MSPLAVESPPERPPVRRRTNGRVPPPTPPTGGGDDDRDGSSGRPLDNVRLAMMFLIAGEVMFFAALVSGFFVLRLAAPPDSRDLWCVERAPRGAASAHGRSAGWPSRPRSAPCSSSCRATSGRG